MQKLIFLSEARFLSPHTPSGGVKSCTNDFIRLFQEQFEVIPFPVHFRKDLPYRIVSRVGLDCYNYFNRGSLPGAFYDLIESGGVSLVAFNTAQTLPLARFIKERTNGKVKTILLSHGNDSGDFLHETTRFKEQLPLLKRATSSLRLGRLLKKEAEYRRKYLDLVLTVSPVEDAIEKWLNAPRSFFVPRTIIPSFATHKPVPGRVGFVGDISHFPNYYALEQVCIHLAQSNLPADFRIVGGPQEFGEKLWRQFPFISYLGYLDEDSLDAEMSSWAFFLNLTFYYSKGVSTKLAKGLTLGVPVISTETGRRGYIWKEGGILIGKSPAGIVRLIEEHAFDEEKIQQALAETRLAAESTPSYSEIMAELLPVLQSL